VSRVPIYEDYADEAYEKRKPRRADEAAMRDDDDNSDSDDDNDDNSFASDSEPDIRKFVFYVDLMLKIMVFQCYNNVFLFAQQKFVCH
jgi:hypothetical protein